MEWLLAQLTALSATSIYLALGGLLLACGLGLPIPEDISLIAAGYLAHIGKVNVHWIFSVCFLAVLGGDTLTFLLGHFYGPRLLRSAFAQKHFSEKKQRRVRAYFRKFGSKVVFIGRFLPGLRASIFFSAGCLHVRPSVFFLYDALAAAVSVPALVYLAYIFGAQMDSVINWAHRSEYGILAIAGVVITIVVVKVYRGKKTGSKKLLAPTPGKAPSPPHEDS